MKNQAPLTPEQKVLSWIKSELSGSIRKAIEATTDQGHSMKQSLRSESLLAAIACRETAIIISKYMDSRSLLELSALTKGDFTKRKKDPKPIHHGYSFWQIDIDSYPSFVKSGRWKDPVTACVQAIVVLFEKYGYLKKVFPLLDEEIMVRASIAAYNCGQGNMKKIIATKLDLDILTTKGNYSADVLRLKSLYEKL